MTQPPLINRLFRLARPPRPTYVAVCSTFDVAREVVNGFLSAKEPFTVQPGADDGTWHVGVLPSGLAEMQEAARRYPSPTPAPADHGETADRGGVTVGVSEGPFDRLLEPDPLRTDDDVVVNDVSEPEGPPRSTRAGRLEEQEGNDWFTPTLPTRVQREAAGPVKVARHRALRYELARQNPQRQQAGRS